MSQTRLVPLDHVELHAAMNVGHSEATDLAVIVVLTLSHFSRLLRALVTLSCD
jgi:hypothetical protein